VAVDVLTNRYTPSRAGVNGAETRLVKSKIKPATFGKLFTRTVDGDLYAQPLIVSGLRIGKHRRNVVYLATSRNWVYAYDADDPSAYLPIWARTLGPAVPRNSIAPELMQQYLNFGSEVGITSTPVIQREGRGGRILVVAKTMHKDRGEKPVFEYRLHALDILTGKEVRPSALIEASVTNASGKKLEFDPRLGLNRPGLLLQNGVLFIAFGSHGDVGRYYGWILAYDAATLGPLAAYNTAPDWGEGGVWQSGTGLAGDGDGFVFAVVGNGRDEEENGKETPPIMRPWAVTSPGYGNAMLKLQLVADAKGSCALRCTDWFTASDVFELNNDDQDFIGGPVLFEALGQDGSTRKFILSGGKDGRFYLADRDRLGHWMAGSNNAVLQADKLCTYHIHGAPVAWRKTDGETLAFVWSEKDFVKCFALAGNRFENKPLSVSDYGLPQDENRMPGGILSLSWDGHDDETAVLWASHPTRDDAMNKTVDGTLRAYDPLDLNRELWTSDMDPEGNDRVGKIAKFSPPVVANGKVYLGTFSRELAVYGLFQGLQRTLRTDDLGFFTLRNIGTAKKSGFYACNKYDLRISGRGFSGSKDDFLFASIERNPSQGRIVVTARIDGINAPQSPKARVGLMIRRSYDPSERFAAVLISKEGQALFLHRDSAHAPLEQDGPVDVTLPIYIKIAAEPAGAHPGTLDFSGEISRDGVAWQRISALTLLSMDTTNDIVLHVGLAVTAQTGVDRDTSAFHGQAIFSHVDVA
jgi:outer membrane protein assembly factor BamB